MANSPQPLSHFDNQGQAHMVDVSEKPPTARQAIAQAKVLMSPETLQIVMSGQAGKGDVLGVARLAGIMGAKRTADLIPLCHPLFLSKVTIDLRPDPALPGIWIEASVKTTGQTGVEMEALTAVSVSALTVYDMIKSVEKAARVTDIHVLRKEGGKSGVYHAAPLEGDKK